MLEDSSIILKHDVINYFNRIALSLRIVYTHSQAIYLHLIAVHLFFLHMLLILIQIEWTY